MKQPNPLPPSALPGVADEELVRRSAGGDEAAFEAIMRRYNQRLYRTARSIVTNDEEAHDVLQEAYLKAWNAMAGFRGEARLGTWMTRIVINEALGRLRQRKPGVVSLEDALETPSAGLLAALTDDATDDNPERAAMRDELHQRLEDSIDRLPEMFRTVFVLRGVQGLDAGEVASALGIPRVTVRTRYFRARRMLRKLLGEAEAPPHHKAYEITHTHHDRVVGGVLGRVRKSQASD